ncbi:MAG: hypothetical protein EPN53_01020 [Acidobacteria bacterium]|nr:MAG: hypothetical protein EPN53_01020 [Acidobacteriota bacterium]
MRRDLHHDGAFYRNGISLGERAMVDETTDGRCPCCQHEVPRRIKGTVRCPCGATVRLQGRTKAEVLRDRVKALGGAAS